MTEEQTTLNVDGQNAQTTSPDGDVDYEILYQKEKKYSQSLRSRAQEAETKNGDLSLKAEDDRQAKLIAEGKKDDLIAELSERNKAAEADLSGYRKEEALKKESLLESIDEKDRVYYENMTLTQLEHFVSQSQSPDVSNPAVAVQGRTNADFSIDSFMKENDKFKRENYGDILKSYTQKASNK
jgi:hypothetical protein